MRIVQLHAENFKRLGVVEINPDGNLVTIGGKNGHGKSSVLDAIYVALRGRAVAPPQPIRKGEERCTIRLDMGDIIVTRKFHQKEGGEYTDTLKVENAEGLTYTKQPQAMLNALLGEIGFDPFEFVKMEPKKQAARLLEMVPLAIDLDEFAELDASDTVKRRDVNREANALKAQIEGIPKEDAPAETPDREALVDKLGNAANTNAAIERESMRREAQERGASEQDNDASNARAEAARLRKQADDLEANATDYDARAKHIRDTLAALPPLDEPVDTDDIREQLREAEAALALIDRQTRRAALVKDWETKAAESKAFTAGIEARAAERNKALAEAEMPVEGLTFAVDEKGEAVLMFDGLPFDKDQISTAVQLRVSTAIGMAANPRLRVLRIMDGSLLDEDSMRLLAEMADAEDFQLWVEVVGNGGTGIIMENGLIKGAAEPDAESKDDVTAGPGVEGEADSAPPAPKAKKGKAKPETEGGLL